MLNLMICGAVGLAVAFGVWAIFSLKESPIEASPLRKQQPGLITGIGIVVALLFLAGWMRPAFVPGFAANPRALFEESRAGVTRSDVRDVLRDMENRVPDVLRDSESRLPQISADIEREMLKNAHKYGLSDSDVRAQVREMEAQSRQQIRGMDDDVRREIREMESKVWDELRRIERGY